MLNWLLKKLLAYLDKHDYDGIGFRDVSVNALWDPADEPEIDKEFELIRREIIPPNFQDKLNRVRNDQTARFESSGKLYEPIHVTAEKWDMVTLSGMFRMGQLATGKTNRYFSHYAVGTGDAAENQTQSKLVAEHARVSMITDGFAEPSGASMRFAGKFSTTVPTATIYEGGVFDSAVGGTMLFRTKYDETNKIEHRQYQTNFTASQTVSMISIT